MKKLNFDKIKRLAVVVFLVALLLPGVSGVKAQEEPLPEGPFYEVQDGDNLWQIALQFNISVEELAAANGILDTSSLTVGDLLVIPGLPQVSGLLTTREVNFGETLSSLSRLYRTEVDDLAALNRIVSPAQLYRGASLILTEDLSTADGESPAELQRTLRAGVSPLELAVLTLSNPWAISERNNLGSIWTVQAGESVLVPGTHSTGGSTGLLALPEIITGLQLRPDPIEQGSTAVLDVQSSEPIQLRGSLAGEEFVFFDSGQGYIALQGIYGLLAPGFYPLSIEGELGQGEHFGFSQYIFVRDAGFPFDPPLTVDPSTIDPAVTQPENEQILALTAPRSPEKFWDGIFTVPVAPIFAECFPSRFGNRRSYNGSTYDAFHTGLDFCGQTGDDIYAPADGRVVFSGPLTVRGNTTIIDHGWGVYTVYMHQSEILVETDEMVSRGQLIGRVGSTGRVTGAHLHWEIWAGGIQVDPIYWLQESYP